MSGRKVIIYHIDDVFLVFFEFLLLKIKMDLLLPTMGYFACTSHVTLIHTRITSNECVISFFIGASYFVLLLCQPAIRLLLISAFWTFRRNTRTLFRSRSRSDTLFLSHSHLILFHTEFLLLFIDSSSVCQHLWMPPPTSYAVAIAAAAMVTTITHF